MRLLNSANLYSICILYLNYFDNISYFRVLIQELADYEKMPDGPKITAETLEQDGFGPNKFFDCIVAELENKVNLWGNEILFLLFSIAACWLQLVLLHLLHLGGQVSVHGGSVRPT